MRKPLWILILFSMYLTSQGQVSGKYGFPYRRHLLGLNYSNDFTSQFNNRKTPEAYNNTVRYGYAAALLYQYRPTKWFSVETGIEINSTTYYLDNPNSNIMTAWDGVQFNPTLPNTLDYGWRIERWALPVNFRWYYQKNQWSIYALAGIFFSVDWHRTQLSEIPDWDYTSNLFETQRFQENFGIGINTGIGAEYKFRPRWVLRLEPRFRVYDLYKPVRPRSSVDDGTIYARDWAVGLNLGIYYGIGKK